MFNEMSNPAFNNTSFTQCNILFMEPEKEMHPSMLRFYEAMKALKGVEGQSAAAKVLFGGSRVQRPVLNADLQNKPAVRGSFFV